MLDKKQIQVIFLFKFQMCHKTAETTHNITITFGPGTANKHTVKWWFKKLCKGDNNLEDESVVVGHQKLTKTNYHLKVGWSAW